ncbi:folate-binding protein YgfZ [Sulfitobacter sp. 20_GPM-1509m]|uniref:CAF17-like 4Fe-4S cluster assembly/insertion protein YgfZ n=1 Tax=Sulfitobacter sp. 20_GPM-1509m TaxID=1380367 RepID=UPI00048D689D|nr:folate-binding protein YgfZ [Sulfitobacter sp. 20_GPM-1509m]
MTDRTILRLSGADTRDFLQGLVTNDVKKLDQGLVYAALLTPQGKYIADFFLKADGDDVLLDADATQAPALMQRLSMYKLRADVTLAQTGLHLHRGLGDRPDDALPDPRHPALGWRAYRDAPQTDDTTDWTALYVENLVPSAGRELHPDTFILEVGFERLNGVDFRKGCYVGQEVTARMKHKTELRKGLAQVHVDGPAEPGAEITTNGKPAGTLHSRAGDRALAYLRFDRANGDMQAADATVRRLD